MQEENKEDLKVLAWLIKNKHRIDFYQNDKENIKYDTDYLCKKIDELNEEKR